MRGCTGTARRWTGRVRGGAPEGADVIPSLFPLAAKVRETLRKNGHQRRVRNAEVGSSILLPSTTNFQVFSKKFANLNNS
jgi:hypothetical protein